MDRDELAGLPALLDVPEAARVLGIGRSFAYELVRRGEWPTTVLRIGRLIKIPSGPLVRLVESGVDGSSAASVTSANIFVTGP